MKAVVLKATEGPESLEIQEVAEPTPASGEVKIKLMASALNRRDYGNTLGLYPGTVLPCILGSDGAGVVESVGDNVDESFIGKEVIIYPARNWGDNETCFGPSFSILGMPNPGTFAEYICVPGADIHAKPVHLNWEQAAAVPLAGLTSWRAVVTQGEVKAGQNVLITGAGSGVSTFAITWAKQLGANVYVTSGNREKIEKALTMGVKAAVNYCDEDYGAQLSSMVDGFDVIIDSAGGDGIHTLLNLLKPAGRFVFFGITLGNTTKVVDMGSLLFRHIRLQGTTMGSPKEFSEMIEFVENKKIEPVIDRVLTLDDAIGAHKLLANYSQMGKIVMKNC